MDTNGWLLGDGRASEDGIRFHVGGSEGGELGGEGAGKVGGDGWGGKVPWDIFFSKLCRQKG